MYRPMKEDDLERIDYLNELVTDYEKDLIWWKTGLLEASKRFENAHEDLVKFLDGIVYGQI